MTKEEAIKIVKNNWPDGRHQLSEALKFLIPELRESEDERIRKDIVTAIEMYGDFTQTRKEVLYTWLEKKMLEVKIRPVLTPPSPHEDPFRFNLESCLYNFGKEIAAACFDTHILDEELDEYVTDERVRKHLAGYINGLYACHPVSPMLSKDEVKVLNDTINLLEEMKLNVDFSFYTRVKPMLSLLTSILERFSQPNVAQ